MRVVVFTISSRQLLRVSHGPWADCPHWILIQEDAVQRPSEWPFWHDADRPGEQDIGAPFRQDIALSRYLDRQREHRQAGMPIVDFEGVLRLVAAVARVGAAVSRRRAEKGSPLTLKP
ncbi:MAG: hypothetical protein E5V90_19275 [Mesorhizobium sp.]|nr:MAG: hypothetical protein E5V90_19275 [Mesorhizobium sp.]